jgi:hypothetical protein
VPLMASTSRSTASNVSRPALFQAAGTRHRAASGARGLQGSPGAHTLGGVGRRQPKNQ